MLTESKIVAAAAIIVAATTLQAAALEGRDGDNNPVPASSYGVSVPNAFASTRDGAPAAKRQSGDVKSADQNAVYWRGRYLGTDPDPNVRLRILREAIGG